jgi:hypothetical protein
VRVHASVVRMMSCCQDRFDPMPVWLMSDDEPDMQCAGVQCVIMCSESGRRKPW